MVENGNKFLGTYFHGLDDRNRLSLPSKIACEFDGSLVVSKGLDGCLELSSKTRFDMKTDKLLSMSENKRNARAIVRQFLANAMTIDIDKANRILIPQTLKVEANLEKDVVILGLGNKLEIWDKVKYEKYKAETDKEFEAIAESLDEI